MDLRGLLDLLHNTETYAAVVRALRTESPGAMRSLGVIRSARPFVLAALAHDWNAPIVYITARVDRAYNVSEQLPVWLGEVGRIFRFSEPAPHFYERSSWGESVIRSRIETLAALLPQETASAAPRHPVVITSARALMQRTLPVQQFRISTLTLKPGQRWNIDRLLARWLGMGYERVAMVVDSGTFTRRGGLLDIYPTALNHPVRIEFFDDEIESIRTFDPETQRTTGRLDQVMITPGRESLPEFTPAVARHLEPWFSAHPLAGDDMTSPQSDAEPLASGSAFPYIEHYLPYLYPQAISLLDYAPIDALVIVEDLAELRDTVRGIEETAEKTRAEKLAAGELAPDHPTPYLTWEQIEAVLRERRVVSMSGFDQSGFDQQDEAGGHPTNGALRGLLSPEKRFGGQLKPMLTEIRALSRQGDRIVAVTAQAARLDDLWRQQDSGLLVRSAAALSEAPAPGTVLFIDGVLHEGWRLRTANGETHLFTDAEIFGWNRPEPRRRKSGRKTRTPENAVADIREGDYVVHVDYGLGRFVGLCRRTLEGTEREYLEVEYGGGDTLFVPIHQADRLTRYVGPDDRPPTLNRLGQADWIRIRTRAQKAAEDEARELLDVYARRAAATKTPFSPDTHWQAELEASFPYVETEDQLKAVQAVKMDMESAHPMDRLICGDVGYGKTEVALRAAFKAVMDGKQVAVLVPTTILAQQHYETFSRRLAAFPLKVEMLSRFRSRDQEARIIRQLAVGEIDIIIGTHRLLSPDIQMRDLGLIIIDEEQRFGVKHKEHFKKLRAHVDILTLTATPIPRTLYLSLSGVRDISMIQTPPEDRLPVITHVGAFDDRLVRSAVLRELERGGQVFVVHNRVQTIESIREKFQEIVPEARSVVAHGQMEDRLLETVMEQFGNGEFDMLIATSIIESGLDIPNANTLIVDRADWFGLSQLYQLRGRVGRSAQQAYAYFFHPPANRMNQETRSRLETLAEYTDLGSGLQIAMRDLELRGAGDILSTRQTGHVAAIGLHLYTQMLAQAVRDLKRERGIGGEIPAATPISQSTILIDLPLPAYLPADWIPEMALRLQLYRRIGNLTSEADVRAMREELSDRFGALPAAVEGMLYQIEVKLLAQACAATAVVTRGDRIEVRLPYLVEVNRDRIARELGDAVRVTRTAVEIPLKETTGHRKTSGPWMPKLLEVLRQLAVNVAASQALAHAARRSL